MEWQFDNTTNDASGQLLSEYYYSTGAPSVLVPVREYRLP